MTKTFLFAGASSAMAQVARIRLQAQGHQIIGISRSGAEGYNELYRVADYLSELPALTQELNGLVYFPGSINLKPFGRISQQEFLQDFQVSALGAANFIQRYHKQLKDKSSLVLFSTVAVCTGMPFHASVAMAKGAVEGLSRSLAAEFAPKIRVNCIAPSLTNTPMAERLLSSEEKIQQMQQRNPLKMIGSPDDIADAICFLLGEESKWITGQVLHADGGMGALKI